MKPDRSATLVLPFEKGLLDTPSLPDRWLFLNASPLDIGESFQQALLCEQGFRPEFLQLQAKVFSVEPDTQAGFDNGKYANRFSGAMILTSRVRLVNENNIRRAMRSVISGGPIVVCGEKATGISAIRKWASDQRELTDSLSKHHAVCFWFRNDNAVADETVADQSRQGVFSASCADKGSELLSRHFDRRIKGKIADFGAGWGYLSKALLDASDRIESLDLYEAEWGALEAAKKDLGSETAIPVGFHWIDLLSEFRKKPFEWIVMNPPFHHGLHSGRTPDQTLGQSFIQIAASSLVKGGRLLMVANRNLPYEQTLEKAFRKVVKIADEGGYKVLEAVR